ncbi:hypothetical protein FSP39_015496, partial [Pinctada imbricata]
LHITGSDAPCNDQGGHCQEDSLSCTGSYHSGLCSGHASRRCCIDASGSDSPCTGQGGQCQEDSLSCSGSYHTGLCSGHASRRCCVGTEVHGSSDCSGVKIYPRSSWGARSPKHETSMSSHNPVNMFFIHHTDGISCKDFDSCARILRGIQNFHMDDRGWSDIGYSFLVGEDGNVYEGRGWNIQGAHTQGYNSVSYAASVMGDFTTVKPNSKAQAAVKALISCGVSKGYISRTYKLYGHRDANPTDCPGDALYHLIQTWQHYSYSKP